MARHTPNGIVQAMRSLRLSNTLTSRSNIPFLSSAARKYATEAEPVDGEPVKAEPPMAESPMAESPMAEPPKAEPVTTEPVEAVKAAPEIDFEKFGLAPARIVPASPSYFSGSPRFIDHVLHLEGLQNKLASHPLVDASEAPRMAWLKLAQFRDFVGEPVPVKKYKGFLKILQSLNRIAPRDKPPVVHEALSTFLRPGNPYLAQHKPREVDEMGRARAKGKRKESTAVVQLVEGEGEVLVNGKTLVEVFQRLHDRESALWPLRVTDRLDRYNVWATVHGGGVTGQAEAITLAVARALLLHEPGLKPSLRKGTLYTIFISVYLEIITNKSGLQLVSLPSMLVVWRERRLVTSRPARCLPGSSVNWDLVPSDAVTFSLHLPCIIFICRSSLSWQFCFIYILYSNAYGAFINDIVLLFPKPASLYLY